MDELVVQVEMRLRQRGRGARHPPRRRQILESRLSAEVPVARAHCSKMVPDAAAMLVCREFMIAVLSPRRRWRDA